MAFKESENTEHFHRAKLAKRSGMPVWAALEYLRTDMAMRGRGTWLRVFLSCRQGQSPPPERRRAKQTVGLGGGGGVGGQRRDIKKYIFTQQAASKAQKSPHMPPMPVADLH